jgi:hypothetical protein
MELVRYKKKRPKVGNLRAFRASQTLAPSLTTYYLQLFSQRPFTFASFTINFLQHPVNLY